MDYSLLVGIHDCTVPLPAEEDNGEDWTEDDGYDYVSSDEIGEPQSPQGIPNDEVGNFSRFMYILMKWGNLCHLKVHLVLMKWGPF